jgi:hypothetical protein
LANGATRNCALSSTQLLQLGYGRHTISFESKEKFNETGHDSSAKTASRQVQFTIERNYERNNAPVISQTTFTKDTNEYYKYTTITFSGLVTDQDAADQVNIYFRIYENSQQLRSQLLSVGFITEELIQPTVNSNTRVSKNISLSNYNLQIGTEYMLEVFGNDTARYNSKSSEPIYLPFTIHRDYSQNAAPTISYSGNQPTYVINSEFTLNIIVNDQEKDECDLYFKFDIGQWTQWTNYNQAITSEEIGVSKSYNFGNLPSDIGSCGNHNIQIKAVEKGSNNPKESAIATIGFYLMADINSLHAPDIKEYHLNGTGYRDELFRSY